MEAQLTTIKQEEKVQAKPKANSWKARDHIPTCAYIMHHHDGSLGHCKHHVDTETFLLSRLYPGEQAMPIYCNYHQEARIPQTKEERKIKHRAQVTSYYKRMKEAEKRGDPVAIAYLDKRRELSREFKQKTKITEKEYIEALKTQNDPNAPSSK